MVLLGARRVRKTTLLRQLIADACRRSDLAPVLFAFLTNPSMRAALFGPDSDAMGALAETALVTQYLHAPLFRDREDVRTPRTDAWTPKRPKV